MVRMRRRPTRFLSVAAFVAAMALTTAAWAGDAEAPDDGHRQLDELLERELDRLLGHLQGVLDDLPRYALPELNDDGDIIIRRLPRRPEGWPRAPEDPDQVVDL